MGSGGVVLVWICVIGSRERERERQRGRERRWERREIG